MGMLGESFDKGLVTSRDASLLGEGELSRCDDAHYRPNDSSLAPVRARANVASASNSHPGLVYLQFDGVIDRLLIQRSANLETLNTGGTGRTEHKDGRSVVRLEAVHYDNKYMVGNGVNDQFIITTGIVTGASNASGIFPMGLDLLDNSSILSAYFIGSAHADYTSAWLPLTLIPGDFLESFPAFWASEHYHYWATELVSSLGMESGAQGIRFAASASASVSMGGFRRNTQNIKLVFQTKKNSKATHRIIYRSTARTKVSQLNALGLVQFQGSTDNVLTGVGGEDFPLLGERITIIPITGVGSATSFSDNGGSTNRAYASITATVLGLTQSFTRDQKPPTWDVAANFEDSVVTNDVANKHAIRYSFPGSPWSFPSIYFIPFQTNQRDEVTCLAKLGDILVAGMKNNMFRVNFLPRENDGDFVRGRAYEEISGNTGNQSKDGYDIFTSEGTGPKLAFTARDGVWITDGYTLQEATRDIDWENTVDQDSLGSCVLVNVPHLWTLILYYTPKGGTANQNSRALYFNYHPQHIKGGRMKVSGPVTQRRPDGTTTNSPRTNAASYGSNTLFYAAGESSDGRIGKEDQDSAITPKMLVKTRLIYGNGVDSEIELQRIYLLSKNMPTAPSVVTNKIAWGTRKADATSITTGVSAVFVSGMLDRKPLDFFAEAFQLLATSSAPLTFWAVKAQADEAK